MIECFARFSSSCLSRIGGGFNPRCIGRQCGWLFRKARLQPRSEVAASSHEGWSPGKIFSDGGRFRHRKSYSLNDIEREARVGIEHFRTILRAILSRFNARLPLRRLDPEKSGLYPRFRNLVEVLVEARRTCFPPENSASGYQKLTLNILNPECPHASSSSDPSKWPRPMGEVVRVTHRPISQLKPALADGQVGDVAQPDLMRLRGLVLIQQQIGTASLRVARRHAQRVA